MSNINKPAVKPILLGKKIILKPDKVPTIGSDSLVTSGALAEALQNKNVALNDSSDNIIPTGDIIIGRLGEDSAFYIINPNFLGTKWMKLETLETGKLYYDKFTQTYYTFQGYIVENEGRVGYKFEPLVLPSIVKVTWQELKDLRDNSRLIPGLKYRITDYQCTTTQANTQSAGHQFDIVLLALSENKLAEEGWAMMHDNIYDVTFGDGVTKKCWLYLTEVDTGGNQLINVVDTESRLGIHGAALEEFTVNESDKTVFTQDWASDDLTEENLTYNYFQNSNLSAWKVWYCLDNDTARFAWADDNVIGDIENIVVYYPERIVLGGTAPAHDVVYTPTNETQIVNGVTYFKLTILEKVHISDRVELFVNTKNINTETTLYELDPRSGTATANPWNISIKSINYNTPPTEEGRGVIYRLIDEWNNDCPYDFKNIQYQLPMTDGLFDSESENNSFVYTFNYYNSDLNLYNVDASIFAQTISEGDYGGCLGVHNNYISPITRGWYNTRVEKLDLNDDKSCFVLNKIHLLMASSDFYGMFDLTFKDSDDVVISGHSGINNINMNNCYSITCQGDNPYQSLTLNSSSIINFNYGANKALMYGCQNKTLNNSFSGEFWIKNMKFTRENI